MKRICLFAVLTAMLAAACSQKPTNAGSDTDSKSISSLDIEQLNKHIDLDMDISELSVSDLRILRSAFAARAGYPLRDAYLRSVFETTTWYDSLMYAFDGSPENFNGTESNEAVSWRDHYYNDIKTDAVPYTKEELAFIERIKQREDELKKQNFKVPDGLRVNTRNIINPGQLTVIDPELEQMLAKNGFAIVPTNHEQLFHVYEQNDYHRFPAFVTTDLYLQLYHVYFDCVLREVEQEALYPMLVDFTRDMYETVDEQLKKEPGTTLAEAARHNRIFFAVAFQLLTEQKLPLGTDESVANDEIRKVMKSVNDFSDFIAEYSSEDGVMFNYSLFRPRGHYTRSEKLQRYFRTMMWLQSVPFGVNAPKQLENVVQMADALNRHQKSATSYATIDRLLLHLMGPADNLSITQVRAEMKKTGLSAAQLVADEQQMQQLRARLNDTGNRQTRIRPKFENTSHNKVCLLPQRYQPDAEVLQEMVDYKSQPTKRGTPKGLDVFAAMGNTIAERILLNELKEAQQWEEFLPTLNRMKSTMDSVDWNSCSATQWLSTMQTVTEKPSNAPYFMLTPEWDKKTLNAALGAWAELKHDAILYAKQPMGAECGDGGPPEPVVKGYVEPNISFWKKFITLIESTMTVLENNGALTQKASEMGERLKEQIGFLLIASEKELKGISLTEEEYDQLQYIGATVEYMTIELLRDEDQELWNWEGVQGPDRKVALVADVYTANASNNPKHSILYEGIGAADEIYVIVEIDGYLYLTRGAVFSYREFTRPSTEQRMTDEEWQKRLTKDTRQGVPEWMLPILVPLEQAPVDNEEVFYSSGC